MHAPTQKSQYRTSPLEVAYKLGYQIGRARARLESPDYSKVKALLSNITPHRRASVQREIQDGILDGMHARSGTQLMLAHPRHAPTLVSAVRDARKRRKRKRAHR